MSKSKHPRDTVDPNYVPDAVRLANAKKSGKRYTGALFTDSWNKASADSYYATHPEIDRRTGENKGPK